MTGIFKDGSVLVLLPTFSEVGAVIALLVQIGKLSLREVKQPVLGDRVVATGKWIPLSKGEA
jgi:hypothetical protein